jgi:anaphase-promoting complex subunit 6
MCYESLNSLISNHMITSKEENSLVQSLPIDTQCKNDEAELVKYIYYSRLSHPNKQNLLAEQKSKFKDLLKDNLDILRAKAERLYYDGDFEQAYLICRKILEKDQFHNNCVPLYVSSLVHLNKVTRKCFLKQSLKLLNIIHT